MQIERIEIDRFAGLEGQSFGPFSPGVSVIHDSDDQSAPEILAFIQTLLGGFTPAILPAIERERIGGRLLLCDAAGHRVLVERHSDLLEGAARVSLPGGRSGGDELLSGLLGGLPPASYLTIFSLASDALDPRSFSGLEHAAAAQNTLPAASLPAGDGAAVRERRAAISGERRDIERKLAILDRGLGQVSYLARMREAVMERIELARAELAGIEARAARARRAGEDEAAGIDIDPHQLRLQIDELRETWTRLQATRRMSEVYRQTADRQRLPRGPIFWGVMLAGALLPLLAGTVTGQRVIIALGAAAAVLGTVTLVLAAIARMRFDTAQMQAQMQLEITHRDAEARYLQAALTAGIDDEDVHGELERLQASLRAAEAAQQTREENRELEIARRSVEARLSEAVEDLAAIDRELSLSLEECDELATAAGFHIAGAPDAARASLERARDALLIETGRLDQQLQQLETRQHSGTGKQATRGVGTEQVALRDAALRAAGEALDAMTLGAYHRLEIARDSGDPWAISRSGVHTPLDRLESSARVAAALALRIGMVRAVGARSGLLPLLVDDFFSLLDPELAPEALRALTGLAGGSQLLIFTARSATVGMARRVCPSLRVITPTGRTLSGLDHIWLNND